MDISALGAQSLNNARFNVKAPPTPKAGGNTAFADILSAIPEPDTGVGDEAQTTKIIPLSNRKPVIDKTSKLYELCLEYETFLTKILISGMRGTVQKAGLIDDSFAGKMYEDMLYDEYAKTYTKNANFGLADLAYMELKEREGKGITRD